MLPHLEFPVTIVGGGLGGLTCASVLQKHGFEVTVYEREEGEQLRSHLGGILDLREDTGQWALSVAGLTAEFQKAARPEGEDMRILAPNGTILFDELSEDSSGDRPEIDRPLLRRILIQSLKPGTIQWDHELTSVLPLGNGKHELIFSNGKTVDTQFLVGADGASSVVRSLVTPALPSYTGVCFVEIGISDADEKFPHQAKLVGRGSMMTMGDNKGIIAQKNGNGRIRIYLAFRMSIEAFGNLNIDFSEPSDARSRLASQFKDWAPDLLSLIHSSDDNMYFRPLNAMPVGITWPSKSGVTLLGDAAHQMSPFAGAGANLAMQDGASLALEILYNTNPSEAIKTYEKEMFYRAQGEAQESADGLEMCISENGSEKMAELMVYYATLVRYVMPFYKAYKWLLSFLS
jgi:2-polyprenyl-6-methoxyphenol hydroxylase-like FAD-dependent oxidoreductase